MNEVEASKNKNKMDINEEMNNIITEAHKKLLKEMMEGVGNTATELGKKIMERVKNILECNEELKKLPNEKNEELKKKNEELKRVMKEKNADLTVVIEMVRKLVKENEELKKVINEKDKKMEEERCDLKEVEDFNYTLLIRERQSNDEIQEASKELIRGLRDLSGEGSTIGVKRMGELDEKPFVKVCQQRFSGENVELEHALLCSEWRENLRDSSWYPFKRVRTGEKMKEVVDEEDEKVKNLREEWGEDVMNAVKTALEELDEFNPSGRYPVPALWNFEQGRKATLKEGIAQMTQQVRDLKRKRT